jgi:hypothetical protein
VFDVSGTTNKKLKVVIPGKRWIIRVKNVVDEEEFDQFDEIPPFATSMIKPRIPPANKGPYLRNDRHEKVKNFRKQRQQCKVAKWLCKICSMYENMTICMNFWLSMDICVKYAQCVKIWPFVWKYDFYWIFVQNMLNVWKYGHFCKNVTFIGYLCEICSMFENIAICVKMWLGYLCEIFSMCENMAIWCIGSIFEVCAASEVLCLVSDLHYTESDNSSVSNEDKGRRTHETCASYLNKREMHIMGARLLSQ